jgi:rhodanese-related sulfurtransferase
MDPILALIITVAVVVVLLTTFRSRWVREDRALALLTAGAKVIDVRRPDEFAQGAVPGAINIPLDVLTEELPQRISNKSQPLLLHCLGGVRSQTGAAALRKLGYTEVHNLGSLSRARSILAKSRPSGVTQS